MTEPPPDDAAYQVIDLLSPEGDVARARDLSAGRTVVLRRLREPSAAAFEQARAAMALSHPHVATVFEVATDANGGFAVTEYVSGDRLDRLLGGRPLNVRRALDIAVQLADALAEVHAAGFVHGDIRPRTIVVNQKGQAKLLDLGLGAWTRGGRERANAPAAVASDEKRVSDVLAYLSPEQALAEPVDARSDIFSLGAVIYTMLVGEPPFTAATGSATLLAVLQGKLVPAGERVPSLPLGLDPILARALSRGLDRRYQSAAELSADLRAVIAEEEQARPPAAPRPVARAVQRSAMPPMTMVIVLVIVTALVAAAWLYRDRLLPGTVTSPLDQGR